MGSHHNDPCPDRDDWQGWAALAREKQSSVLALYSGAGAVLAKQPRSVCPFTEEEPALKKSWLWMFDCSTAAAAERDERLAKGWEEAFHRAGRGDLFG